jgi:hypothetical protein
MIARARTSLSCASRRRVTTTSDRPGRWRVTRTLGGAGRHR